MSHGALLARPARVRVASLLDQLHTETEAFHAEADADALELLGPVAVADYWRFLVRTYGFVASVERAIAQTPGLDDVVDMRRFHKHTLLRQDLLAFGMLSEDIHRVSQCVVPRFTAVEQALGWAYVIERSTLGHSNLFRHLGMVMPGNVAFTSAYLKCYFGAVGEMWRSFGEALERYAHPARARRVIDAAKAAFRAQRSWRYDHDFESEPPSDSGIKRIA